MRDAPADICCMRSGSEEHEWDGGHLAARLTEKAIPRYRCCNLCMRGGREESKQNKVSVAWCTSGHGSRRAVPGYTARLSRRTGHPNRVVPNPPDGPELRIEMRDEKWTGSASRTCHPEPVRENRSRSRAHQDADLIDPCRNCHCGRSPAGIRCRFPSFFH